MNEELKITNEWDKVFPMSDKVNHKKVIFKNYFGISLVADLYDQKDKILFDKIEKFLREYLK